MTFIEIYLIAAITIWVLASGLWLLSVRLRNASIVDPFWGGGFVVTVWLYFALTPGGWPGRKWLLVGLATIWGGRLALYLLWRGWGEAEDFRYQEFRRNNGAGWWWKSYFKVFIFQGALMWIISAPLLAAQMSPTPAGFTGFDLAAVLLWGIGFFFEAVGDWQLARFKSDPANKGRLLTGGVWRLTRHPNYFGDAAQWWGFYLVAAAAGGGWTIFSPLLMTVLLLRVSGVVLLEKTLKETKPGYQDYMNHTSAFIPWLPGK